LFIQNRYLITLLYNRSIHNYYELLETKAYVKVSVLVAGMTKSRLYTCYL